MSNFSSLEEAPVDPIFGLNQAFLADPRKDKVNLGIGVYRGANLKPPVLEVVRRVEGRLVEEGLPKTYLPIEGDPDFIRQSAHLVFGNDSPHLPRIYGAQAVGGTGALRLAGDFLKQLLHIERIYVTDPTWSNHLGIFPAAGLQTEYYPYYDRVGRCLDFERLCAAVREIPPSSAILLHACCHNPTGLDPTMEQWEELADLIGKRGILPLFDSAYQGFGEELDLDAGAIRLFVDRGIECLVASSFSKNLGLYAERVAALFVVMEEECLRSRVASQISQLIRRNYSNPPCHGVRIASRVMGDAELSRAWREELAAMRGRIHEMRKAFVAGLMVKAVSTDFSFLGRQQGLFSYTGLSRGQVERLKQEHAIYMPSSGRINVTGLTTENMDQVVEAIASVLE